MIQFVPQAKVQSQPRVDFPVVLHEEMFIVEILDAEQIAREGPSTLKGKPQQEVGPGIAGIGSAEREISAAAGCVCRCRVVPPEMCPEFQRVRALDPGEAVDDLILIVPEMNRTERIRIEAQITGD